MPIDAHRVSLSTRSVGLMLTMISLAVLAASDAVAMGANPAQFVIRTRCPPLKTYTAEQSKQIGQERKRLRGQGGYPLMLETNDDYLLLRDQCRAVEGK
jgi:hypothetical protein